MKTLYLECKMGAAGDMLMAALYELLDQDQREEFLRTMNHLGLPGVEVAPVAAKTSGIAGTHMRVTVHGQEEHGHHHGHEHLLSVGSEVQIFSGTLECRNFKGCGIFVLSGIPI